jgi:hypothetical protein
MKKFRKQTIFIIEKFKNYILKIKKKTLKLPPKHPNPKISYNSSVIKGGFK